LVDRGFKALDKQLMATDAMMGDRRGAQVFHYRLRAKACYALMAKHRASMMHANTAK
jgi:hypothetical protein